MQDTATAAALENPAQVKSETPKPSTPKSPKPAAKKTGEAEQIKMGSITISVPQRALKFTEQYRQECGNKRADRAEERAHLAARNTYLKELLAAYKEQGDYDEEIREFERSS